MHGILNDTIAAHVHLKNNKTNGRKKISTIQQMPLT